MLSAIAVCPHPPLLIPAVAAGAAPELDDMRAAALLAVGRLLASDPGGIIVVGDGPGRPGYLDPASVADFRGYGVDLVLGDRRVADAGVDADAGVGAGSLPLSLAVGRWLLGEAGCGLPVAYESTSSAMSAATAATRGGEVVAATPGRVALLVMGDGTARRSEKAPGAFDPDAQPLDDEIAAALAGADTDALLALSPARCERLLVAGRASWQFLAGAAVASDVVWRGELLAHEAPYGVGYFVASWR